MGFSQADRQDLQINLNKIRFGTRSYRPPLIKLSSLPQADKPKLPPSKDRHALPDEPWYKCFQIRLW